jgi:hypothetical protein
VISILHRRIRFRVNSSVPVNGWSAVDGIKLVSPVVHRSAEQRDLVLPSCTSRLMRVTYARLPAFSCLKKMVAVVEVLVGHLGCSGTLRRDLVRLSSYAGAQFPKEDRRFSRAKSHSPEL